MIRPMSEVEHTSAPPRPEVRGTRSSIWEAKLLYE